MRLPRLPGYALLTTLRMFAAIFASLLGDDMLRGSAQAASQPQRMMTHFAPKAKRFSAHWVRPATGGSA